MQLHANKYFRRQHWKALYDFFLVKFQFIFVGFKFFLLGIVVALAILINLIERVI